MAELARSRELRDEQVARFLRVLLREPLSVANFLSRSSTLELRWISRGSMLCIKVASEAGVGASRVLKAELE